MGDVNGIRSTAARIHNCLVRQLNECKNMPRMIIVVTDNDIIKGIAQDFCDYGAKHLCERVISWLVNTNNKAITARREELKRMKPGSVMAGEPKVVYTKMIYRPKGDKIQAIRNHFNVALENCLCKVHSHYIVDIAVQNTLFDLSNFLMADGQKSYWNCLDRQLQDFDEKRSNGLLKPIPQALIKKPKENFTEKFRMPPPPPLARKNLQKFFNKEKDKKSE